MSSEIKSAFKEHIGTNGAVYQVSTQPLGKGGYGKVFPATVVRDNQVVQVAFKVIDASHDPLVQKRLNREPEALKELDHDKIIKIIDTYEYLSGDPDEVDAPSPLMAIITELAPGVSLSKYIHDNKKIDSLTAMQIFEQVVMAVKHCHKTGFAHRDLKPANIVIDAITDRDNPTIKLIDFGCSRRVPRDSSGTPKKLSTPCGTRHYDPPEVLQKQDYDAEKRDVWSLGVILYKMLTGKYPYDDENNNQPTLIRKICNEDFTFPDELKGGGLEKLIRSMMNKNTEERITLDQLKTKIDAFWASFAQADDESSDEDEEKHPIQTPISVHIASMNSPINPSPIRDNNNFKRS